MPTVAALLVVVLTVALGFWQLDRARQRDALDQRLQALRNEPPVELGHLPVLAAALELHPVAVRGSWQTERSILLDNQPHHGKPGYHVLTPLRIAGSDMHVLVNRGWIAVNGDRAHPPQPGVAPGEQQIVGFARQRPPHYMALGKGEATINREGAIWSDVTPAAFAAWSGLRLQPLVLYQTSDSGDGLLRDWPQPGSGADRNRGYAFQWFALSLMTALFWAYARFGRKKAP